MPISINALKPGDTVYAVTRERAGNTTTTRTAVRPVHIKEIDPEKGTVLASWNYNPPRTFHARDGKLPWQRSKPPAR